MAKEKICGIYCIKNLKNGKCYVGQSVNIYTRWNQHKSQLRKNNHYNTDLQIDWNLYQEHNFEFKILCECNEEKLDFYEIEFIRELGAFWNGYNNDFGGRSGIIYEHCLNESEHKTLKKMLHEKIAYRYRPILQIDFDGNIVNEWGSASYAAYSIDGNQSEIAACLHKKSKTYKRYIWIYKDEYDYDTFDVLDYTNNLHNIDHDIFQYSLDGILVGIYSTGRAAAEAVGVHENTIYDCLHKRSLSAAGYIWRYSDEDFESYRVPKEKHKICQYDKKGNLLAIYDNTAEAMKVTGITNGIYDCLYGKIESSHGFLWKYEGEEVNISNIKHSIGKFDLNENLIDVYDSVSAALRSINKKNHQSMYECLRGIRDSAYGFIWKYV